MVALIAVPLSLALAGCGDNDNSESTAASGGPEQEQPSNVAEEVPPEPGSAVSTGTPSRAGRAIVSRVGFTLYTTDQDKKNSGETSCYGKCAKVWIPYTTLAPPGVMLKARASMLGTVKRKDGLTQVTYGGYPLYTYKPDGGAARATGAGVESFGGTWRTINPKGEVVG